MNPPRAPYPEAAEARAPHGVPVRRTGEAARVPPLLDQRAACHPTEGTPDTRR